MAKNNQNQIQLANNKGTLSSLLNSETFQANLKDVLPRHLTPERVCKMALIAASRQPRLFQCTQASVLQSIMKSAELGLDCTGTLGQGYLVPYYNGKIQAMEAQFIPGYQGLIDLARRSGNIRRIESRVVHENDTFNFAYGLNQTLQHIPFFAGERGLIVVFYAIAEMSDGSQQLEVMTNEEVAAIRDRSKSKDRDGNIVGPWRDHYSEMGRKTVVRRLAKYLPLSPEMVTAFDADNQQYHDTLQESAAAITAGVAGLKDRMAAQKEPEALPASTEQPAPIGEEVEKAIAEQKKQQVDAVRQAEQGDSKQPDEPEQKPEAEQKPLRWRCGHCDHEFEHKKNGKCPKCFSKTIIDQRPPVKPGEVPFGNEGGAK